MTLRANAGHRRPRWIALLATITVGATLISGTVIAASGTDASVVDYSQCANGAPGSTGATDDCVPKGWIFGILNANNSQYREDQVTAQRLILSLPAGGPTSGRTIKIKWLVRKGTHHAYDSLATWDYTQQNADPCQSLSGGTAPTCQTIYAAGPKTEPIPPDGSAVTPVSGGLSSTTSDHQLSGQQLEMYGLGASGDIDSATYGGVVDESGDLYESMTITYHVDGLSTGRTVMLLFGGHLAAGGAPPTSPRGWGTGNGASDINGGPYHIKLVQVDGASIGNRDNQIMSSAILPLALATISTTPSASVTWSATLNDSATITGNSPTGTVTFALYDDGADTCTEPPLFSKTVALTSGSASTTGAAVGTVTGSNVVTSAGTYEWRVSYSGDSNNVASGPTTCGDETEVVTAPSTNP